MGQNRQIFVAMLAGVCSKEAGELWVLGYQQILAGGGKKGRVVLGRQRHALKEQVGVVIVNSKLLKRHSKAKRRAPAYSRALRQIRGVFERTVRGRLRSGCQNVKIG